ncbi:J domain-containing protein [Aestuariivirga sp.]|uniref:J domain-containing protein n=1 Tax=Aestuariivirga sp. TaxID=2650926 RepID=UPI0039E262AD
MFEKSGPQRSLVHLTLASGKTMMVSLKLPMSGKLADVLNNADRYLDVLGPEGEQFFLSKDMVHRVAAADPPKASLNLNRRSSDQSGFNPWAVLGVTREASADDIRAAWLSLVKMYHPDRFANLEMPQEMKDYAAAMLARINVAHDQLAASVTPK